MKKVPPWMDSLVSIISNCMEPHSEMGPLGFLFKHEEDSWDIIVYPFPIETADQGSHEMVTAPGFCLDLELLRSAFDRLDGIYWNAHSFGPHDAYGPHIIIEGVYQGYTVYLQILAFPPGDEMQGVQFDTSGTNMPIN